MERNALQFFLQKQSQAFHLALLHATLLTQTMLCRLSYPIVPVPPYKNTVFSSQAYLEGSLHFV